MAEGRSSAEGEELAHKLCKGPRNLLTRKVKDIQLTKSAGSLTYCLSEPKILAKWPSPLNSQARPSRTTASSKSSVVVAWAWCTRLKTPVSTDSLLSNSCPMTSPRTAKPWKDFDVRPKPPRL